MPRFSAPLLVASLLTLLLSFDARAEATRIDRSLQAAQKYLLDRQSTDGAWRSTRYGLLKDGPSLTPHVAEVVYALAEFDTRSVNAAARAMSYLGMLVQPDEQLSDNVSLVYPTYTAAGAMRLGIITGAAPVAINAWSGLLRAQQLNESLGWRPADLEYGGWSYAITPPRRPVAGRQRGPWDWSNLSATTDALDALAISRKPDERDRVFTAALVLVRRCQNLSDDGSMTDARFDDGGFFFSPAEAIRNKAGPAGRDATGRERYRSYGSATVDGIRALQLCGVPVDDPRVIAARRWLQQHFSAERVPGDFIAANQDIRDATWFYYCRGAAHVLNDRPAVSAIVDALIARQRDDGSWVNSCSDGREDDPLIATPLAAAALLRCRATLDATTALP